MRKIHYVVNTTFGDGSSLLHTFPTPRKANAYVREEARWGADTYFGVLEEIAVKRVVASIQGVWIDRDNDQMVARDGLAKVGTYFKSYVLEDYVCIEGGPWPPVGSTHMVASGNHQRECASQQNPLV